MRRARLLAGAALVVTLSLAASACGGSGSSNTTTTTGASATVVWATGICNSFGAWKASLERAKSSLGSSPSSSDLRNAAHQAQVATQALTSSVQQLGPPPTNTNASAQQSIQSLKTQLAADKTKISNTLNGNLGTPAEVTSAVSTVKATVQSMQQSFTSTVNHLKSLDPKSELEKAFHQAKACEPFFT
jgi:exonuclease VII large subunit